MILILQFRHNMEKKDHFATSISWDCNGPKILQASFFWVQT